MKSGICCAKTNGTTINLKSQQTRNMADFVGFLNTNRSETGTQKKPPNILVKDEMEKER